MILSKTARPNQVERILKSRFHDVMTKLHSNGKEELDLLIVVLPDNNGPLYGDLKCICETDLDVLQIFWSKITDDDGRGRLIAAVLVVMWLCTADAEVEYMKYKDPNQPLNVLIKDLMGRMTLEEKIGQMSQIERKVASADIMKKYFIGSDTIMVALTWALPLLLNNPPALKKAQEEVDTYVPQTRHVQETDIKNLVFLQAVVKETLRLYPPAPVIGLHSAIEFKLQPCLRARTSC